jgi:sphingomyelin phosphodiesterase
MPRDPSGVLAFIVSQLQIAEDSGERAWIIGHIPPGRPDALYDYSSYLDQIVQRYDGTLAAMFWGHTHRDQSEISYTDYTNQTAENARMVGYIAPSLTPTSRNPNFRVYGVDPMTFAVLDYTVLLLQPLSSRLPYSRSKMGEILRRQVRLRFSHVPCGHRSQGRVDAGVLA